MSFVTGSLVFRLAGSEVSVSRSPLSGGFVAFVERGTNLDPGPDGDTAVSMGVALANPGTMPRTVVIRLLDAAGGELALAEVALDAGEHLAHFIDEEALFKSFFDSQPDLNEFQGSLLATSDDGDFALTTLRQRLPSGRLSSLGSTAVGAMIQRNAGWQADVQFLVNELVRIHPNPFHAVSEGVFRDSVAQLQTEIPALTDIDVHLRMVQLMARVGDAHTKVGYPSAISPQEPFRIFPIELKWFSDGLFVIIALSEHSELLGARLLEIDSVPVQEIQERIETLIPAETQERLTVGSPAFFQAADALRFLDVTQGVERASFAFETAQGTIRKDLDVLELVDPGQVAELDIATPFSDSNPAPLYLRDTETNYWFEYLEESRTLYLQYNLSRDAEEPFASFASRVFATADVNLVDRFVIDLRHNGGGSANVMEPLLEGLQIRPTLASRLFVATANRTFSAAVINAVQLRDRFGATLVGEPPANKPNFYCEPEIFRLPHSHLEVRISTQLFRLIPDSDPPILMPDILVPLSSADFLAGRDPVLERVLETPVVP